MKKKIALALMLVVLALSTTACVEGELMEHATDTKSQMLLNSGDQYVYTFQDTETGVWYISAGKGVTPRLNVDGSLYVTD